MAGKEKIDKNWLNSNLESAKDKLSSLKNEIKKDKIEKNKDLDKWKEELSSLKKEVKEKNDLKWEKEELSSLKKEVREKKNIISDKKEIYESNIDSDTWKGSFLAKQIAVVSDWKNRNPDRPVEWIQSAYLDVADQIERGTSDKNIFARGLAKVIKTIIQNEK